VDGLCPAQLERAADLFTGGLARLVAEGARFTSAHQEHAITFTGPGHFALMSGRYPGPAGVVANSWYESSLGRWVYCVEDESASLVGATGEERRSGSSYRNVAGSSLGDWLKRRSRASKVFSISRKDRSAVMLGGRAADGAYWFDTQTGAFVTSTFYVDTPHEWVARYNGRHRADDFRDRRWERLLANVAAYESRARTDSFPGELDFSSLGRKGAEGAPTFDHQVADGADVPDADYYDALKCFPFLDEMTMELAHEAITAERLGADEHTDLLCIGLSVLDDASHAAGPFSQETLDVLLRVDRLLGDLFERLDAEVGPHYVVALSSDHGMLPLPEYVEAGHRELTGDAPSRRAGPEAERFRDRLEGALTSMTGGESPVAAVASYGLWIDWDVVRASGTTHDAIENRVRSLAEQESWISHVFARRELLASNEEEDPIVRRYRRSTHPSSSPDYFVCARPGILLDREGTTHGTPYDYDAHVPLMLWGRGVATGAYETPVETVDLAPTMARLLGVTEMPYVDGRVLDEALAPAR